MYYAKTISASIKRNLPMEVYSISPKGFIPLIMLNIKKEL